MSSIGFYITFLLLGAGAAFGFSHKGDPRLEFTPGKKKLVVFLSGVFLVCVLLLLAVAKMTENTPL